MTPQRPALAEVLAAITGRPVGHWRAEVASPAFLGVERISSRDVQWTVRVDPFRATTQTRRATLRSTEPAYEARRIGNTLTRVEVAPAHTIAPAEAVEALATARLWPWEPGDDPTLWWCERCEGIGLLCTTDGENVFDTPCRCRGNPPTLAALVAVASLGAPQLARYVHLAGEIARAAGCEGARVAWRVMGREALRAWMDKPRGGGTYAAVALGLACGMPARDVVPVGVDAAPFVDLADAGVYVMGCDASRIVLAVEAL